MAHLTIFLYRDQFPKLIRKHKHNITRIMMTQILSYLQVYLQQKSKDSKSFDISRISDKIPQSSKVGDLVLMALINWAESNSNHIALNSKFRQVATTSLSAIQALRHQCRGNKTYSSHSRDTLFMVHHYSSQSAVLVSL